MNKKIVTRIAPSPTSSFGLHCGNIRTMIFNYLFAKQNGGIFYLRIEDTDQDRFCEGSEELIKKTLDWMGIQADFSPWSEQQPFGSMRQSERDYTKHIQYLIDNGNAYYSFDSKEEIDNLRSLDNNFSYNASNRMELKNSLTLSKEEVSSLLLTEPYVIRFKVIPNQIITFTDIVRGEITFNSSQMDDKVLVKSNHIPTYHMANCCDDHDMGTTHVIRGEEWLSSVPLHIMIYQAFGWDIPEFAHLPLVLNPPPLKGKLSKRNAVKLGIPIFPFSGDGIDEKGEKYSLKGFVDEGYTPEALINFLMLLGWTPHHDNEITDEIFSLEDGINKFDLHSVHKSGAKYDIEKLKFFNGYYLHNTDNNELLKYVDFGNSNFSYENKLAIIDMAKKRSHFKHEMQSIVDIFIKPVILNNKQLSTLNDDNLKVLQSFSSKIGINNQWDDNFLKNTIYDCCEENGFKMGKIMPIMRTVLAGGITGPDMISFMLMISKEEVINRINEASYQLMLNTK